MPIEEAKRTKQIDDYLITVAALPPFEGVRLTNRLTAHLARAMAGVQARGPLDVKAADNGDVSGVAGIVSSLGGGLVGLFDKLDEGETESLIKRLLAGATVSVDGKVQDMLRVAPALFTGRPDILIRAAVFSAEVNLAYFFGGAKAVISAALGALARERGASMASRTSPPSGSAGASS